KKGRQHACEANEADQELAENQGPVVLKPGEEIAEGPAFALELPQAHGCEARAHGDEDEDADEESEVGDGAGEVDGAEDEGKSNHRTEHGTVVRRGVLEPLAEVHAVVAG